MVFFADVYHTATSLILWYFPDELNLSSFLLLSTYAVLIFLGKTVTERGLWSWVLIKYVQEWLSLIFNLAFSLARYISIRIGKQETSVPLQSDYREGWFFLINCQWSFKVADSVLILISYFLLWL